MLHGRGWIRRPDAPSPEWNPSAVIDRDYEARLHDHYGYGRLAYWVTDDRVKDVQRPERTSP